MRFRLILMAFITLSATATGLPQGESREDLLRRKKEIEAVIAKLAETHSTPDEFVVSTLDGYADVLFQLADYKKALRVYEKIESVPPSNEWDRRSRVFTLLSIANCHRLLDKQKKCDRAIEEAIEKARKWFEGEALWGLQSSMGAQLHGMSQYEHSLALYKDSHDRWKEKAGENDERTLTAVIGYTACLIELGKYDEAKGLISDALARTKERHPDKKDLIQLFESNLAQIHYMKGDYEKAKAALEALIAEDENSSVSPIRLLISYSYVLEQLGEFGRAIEVAERVIGELNANAKRNKEQIDSLEALCKRCRKEKREKEAEKEKD